MNILITGAAGLVGFNACKYFSEQGHHVYAIDNLERSKLLGHEVSEKRTYFNWHALRELKNIDWLYLDITDPDFAHKLPANYIDGIVHLAGQCGVPTSIWNPRRDFEINTLGTFNVLEYARAERAFGRNTKVAFASTNKVYNLHSGWNLEGERWRWSTETWHKNGFPSDGKSSLLSGSRTPYGNSKFMADAMMQEWYHMYGVPTGCFRMSCIYGPNQMGFEEQGWATWFLIAALKDLPITIYGDGKQVRDMLYVTDLIKAYDLFLKSPTVNHGVWNTGGGVLNTLSINECLDFLRGYIGKPIPVEYKDWRPSDQRIYTSDISNLKSNLNWRPTIAPIPGLQITMTWVKENLDVF